MQSKCEKISINAASSIADAMKVLTNEAQQIVLVIDDRRRLIGTVTDGDIRRGLLKDNTLESSVSNVMRQDPIIVTEGASREEIFALLGKHKIHQLPVVDSEGVLVSLVVIDEILVNPKKENLIILMAGGMGRRLGDLTKSRPKPLIAVGGRPILETILLNFVKQGYCNFLISVNYKSDMIQEHFGDGSTWGVNINYLQESQRMGTAGALSLIGDRPDKPFFVMNGDLLTNVNFDAMLKFHAKHQAIATMGVREYDFQVPYGVVRTNEALIKAIDEKPVQHFFVNAGMYVLEPEVIEFIPQDHFFDMPQLFNRLLKKDKRVSSFPIHEYWMDIGRLSELEKAQNDFSDYFGESDEF